MFERLLIRLDAMLFTLLAKMRTIINEKGTDYGEFSREEKKVIGMAASTAKAIKSVLDTPILTEEGKLTDESKQIAVSIQQKCLPERI
jgi:hypothetical protein